MLNLPKTLGNYWMACFISDCAAGKRSDFESVRWPIEWYGQVSPPREPLHLGHIRLLCSPVRYYRGEEIAADPESADSVRVFPPSPVTVTIPKWLHPKGETEATLKVELLPRNGWQKALRQRDALPLLIDVPEGTNPSYAIEYDSQDNDHVQDWKATADIEIAPWAMGDDALRLSQAQLWVLRRWQEVLNIHPISAQLRSVAAIIARPGDQPSGWSQWVEEYRQGILTYQDLVERIYYLREQKNARTTRDVESKVRG